MNGDLLWAIGLPKQHRFPLCYPCRNSSPVRASRISEGFKRPRFTVHNRERRAKLCANFVYCSTRWQSTQVGTGRNQRFTISTAQSNHQRMVGDSYSKRIKAARQPARCCRRRGKDKGDRTASGEKWFHAAHQSAWCHQYRV